MIKTLFPSFIYLSKLNPNDLEEWNQELIQEIFKISEVDEEGLNWCEENYFGGYTSYSSYNRLQDFSSEFKKLEELINTHVKQYIQKLNYNIDPDTLKMSHFWANIMPTGTHHSGHIHPLSVISGTYYLQMPKDSPAIKFEDPRLTMLMNTPAIKEDCGIEFQRFVPLRGEAGDLVLFESYQRHEVPANRSEEDRISVSFNYEIC